ncbi:carbon starvation protein, predicted membrane protein [Thermanaerovibrio velox DSM 12556]|uniref:Carbon starvation protein, predicted membrane protein n=1 Tax=Thermanaerovibrio velox DSM 12556 TaxID=926567 RepID=H0USM0_9BACT|nr:carbon starvation protein A [Thermanaerovibrio velox]EHM10309.1 carbon starvation protein, predicted membrane protein [Thermanaerovibrio velox DSM 12556]
MLLGLLVFALAVFAVCYRFYGNRMAELYALDPNKDTPAVVLCDGVDFCPAHPSVLLGHHFSSIAGAGPIVGPITAASMFGWLPAYIWCLIGSAFVGGPHDMGSLVASMRHEGKSVGEVVDRWIGRKGKVLFLCFTILALVLVVAVFLQLAANSFAADPAVAFSGMLYILLAMVFGVMVYRYRISLLWATVVMVPIVIYACWYGNDAQWVQDVFSLPVETWRWILAVYIFAASVLPVWLLLQPRDYLASYFLYFSVIIGGVGMLLGRGSDFAVTLPAFKGFSAGNQYLWPMLFVVVACGAISGFHSLVGSGTTSKQLRKETDAVAVGYGSMLLEGVVAVIAIGTVMISGSVDQGGPVVTYAKGFGKFAGLLGINPKVGVSLGLLAINSFILTSLDTATRLTRYQIQELTNYKVDKYSATLITVVGALVLLLVKIHGADGKEVPAWAAIWPVFGASNQMVAALALLSVSVWVAKGLKKDNSFLMVPMWFMLVTTVGALAIMIKDNLMLATPNYILVVPSVLLMILAILMVKEAFGALKKDAL